ncbi:lamin tail domain-containing protein (plasmid) [Haladaptatus sp. SPP-AMP-3]|uniref:lamin tail domain-containing protein n=1 Tax=Haladaptatus sp. SPP-AMP-3 TaxID=3121295 RepID=UPI003C2B44DB
MAEPGSEKSGIDLVVEESGNVEEFSRQRAEQLNEKASTLYGYLVGGTGVFAGVTALLSFLGFPGVGTIGISFFKYLVHSLYIKFGLVLYATSIVYALFVSTITGVAGHADSSTLRALSHRHIDSDQFKRELIRTRIDNVSINTSYVKQKAVLLVSALLSLIFSATLLVIGVFVAIEKLEQSTAGDKLIYVIGDPTQTYPVDFTLLLSVFVLTTLFAYFPRTVRITSTRYDTDEPFSWSVVPEHLSIDSILKHSPYLPYTVLIELLAVFLYLSTKRPGGGVGEPVLSELVLVVILTFVALSAIHLVVHWLRAMQKAGRENGGKESDETGLELFHANTTSRRGRLNDEHIAFRNTTDKPLNISNWSVRDSAGHRYDFPKGTILGPEEVVRLHTGNEGEGESQHWSDAVNAVYWGSDRPIWNDDGDTVLVRDRDGTTILETEI